MPSRQSFAGSALHRESIRRRDRAWLDARREIKALEDRARGIGRMDRGQRARAGRRTR